MKFLPLIILLVSSISLAKPTAIFLDTDHCVAWKAIKTLALVKTVKPVGKNCSIKTEIKKDEFEGNFYFTSEFPVKSFDSQEEDRDKEVQNILLADKHPIITFKTNSMPKADWKKILDGTTKTLSGTLRVAGRARLFDVPIEVSKVGEQYRVKGLIKTKYSNFRIKPPSVGGGLIAKAKDYLELHFHLLSGKIAGAEAVLK